MTSRSYSLYSFFCLDRKNLLFNFLSRNLKLKYRQSAFGYFWTLLIPLSQIGVYYFVYDVILDIQVPNYLAYIVSGILPWVFFSASVNESLDSLVSGYHLLTHAPIPIQLFPAASTFANFSNFMISIGLVYIVVALTSTTPMTLWAVMVIPLSMLLLVFTYSFAFLLACMFVFLRDIKHLINIIMQLWLYVTPILYIETMIPTEFRWIAWVNPIHGYFVGIRQCLFEPSISNFNPIINFILWTAGTLLFAEWVRSRYSHLLIEKL